MCVYACFSRVDNGSERDSDEGGGVRPGGDVVDDSDHLHTHAVFIHCNHHHLDTTSEQHQSRLHGETLPDNLHHALLRISIVAKN